jgi:hypothetical protein
VIALLSAFIPVAAWACIFTKPEEWHGGLSYFSPKVNGWTAKTLAGIGTALLLFLLVTAILKFRQIMAQDKSKNLTS